MKIHESQSPAQEATSHINELLERNKETAILLLLSGGSSRDVIKKIQTEVLSPLTTVSLVDERYVFTEEGSNMTELVKSEWFAKAETQRISVIDPRPLENENLTETATRFESSLREWRKANQDGVVVALLGIGDDGHTAGILPMPENAETFQKLFIDTECWAVGYTHPTTDNPYHDRITVTMHFLQTQVAHTIVYASGEQKCSIIDKLEQKGGPVSNTPAWTLQDMPDVHVYTDCVVTLSA